MCEQGKMKSIQLLLETKVCFQPLRFSEQQHKTKVSLRSRRNRSRGESSGREAAKLYGEWRGGRAAWPLHTLSFTRAKTDSTGYAL